MLDYLVPIHPKMVHFPVALFITALGLEIASIVLKREILHQNARLLYVIAALMTPLVVRTGLWEEERFHLNHPVLNWHRTFALWTMWVSLMSLPVLWFIKQRFQKFFRVLFVILLIGVAVFVTLAAHNGGRLVYEYGVGMMDGGMMDGMGGKKMCPMCAKMKGKDDVTDAAAEGEAVQPAAEDSEHKSHH